MDTDRIIDRRKLKRRLTFWRVAAVALLLVLIGVVASEAYKSTGDHIARISIDNIIHQDRDRAKVLAKLATNDKAKALIVHINSPGGTTTGSEELYLGLRQIAKNKPVVAVIGTLGASGGYIAAIGADRIFARETSLTGSIGVVMQTAEFSGLMEKIGVTSEKITSGKMKGEPSANAPIKEEVRVVFQELIDDTHSWFVGLVKDRRTMDDAKLVEIADGRVFTGRQAKDNGLIDDFGGENEAVAWLKSEKEIAEGMAVKDVYWGRQADPIARHLDGLVQQYAPFAGPALDGLLALWQPR
jgi:protease-4